MVKEKQSELLRYQATEEYLIERIEQGEKSRRRYLIDVQKTIQELKNQIEFLKI